MDLSITQVPVWVSVLFFISFSTIPIFLIANAAQSAYKNGNVEGGSSIRKKIILFYWAYLAIIALVSLTGFFAVNVLPPRIILFTAIPLFLFYMLYVQRSQWFKTVFKHIKLEQLVYIHLFRFVGVFFLLNYFYDALPKEFAFIGGLGDIISALLAIPVVVALRKKLTYATPLTFVWNIIGLVDIISVIFTATIVTQQAIENNLAGAEQFGTFPFSWIPAFAPATIIFLHLLVFKKLREASKSQPSANSLNKNMELAK